MSKVAPKSLFHVPGTGAEISRHDVVRCANPSVCHSFYYKHVVNYRNFIIAFTPKLGCSDQTRDMYINLPSMIHCIYFIRMKLSSESKTNYSRNSSVLLQPLSKCYKPNFIERLGYITYKVCALEKRKSSGFSVTTKADSKISEKTKITRFLKPVNTAATYPSFAVSVAIIFASVS